MAQAPLHAHNASATPSRRARCSRVAAKRQFANPRANRLSSYGAMATAAAATAGLAGHAEAAVVQSAAGWSRTLSVAGNGATFAFSAATTFGPGATLLDGKLQLSVNYYGTLGANPGMVRSAFAMGLAGGALRGGNRLAANAVIGNITQVTSAAAIMQSSFRLNANSTFQPDPTVGAWQVAPGSSAQGYLAFAIDDGAGSWFFGYFDVTLSNPGATGTASALTLTINGWAYNSVAGQSITIGAPVAVPGGAGLAALAIGAAGLRGRRRGRN